MGKFGYRTVAELLQANTGGDSANCADYVSKLLLFMRFVYKDPDAKVSRIPSCAFNPIAE